MNPGHNTFLFHWGKSSATRSPLQEHRRHYRQLDHRSLRSCVISSVELLK
jgi:hypothetical protein